MQMKITPSSIAGIRLIAPSSPEFEGAFSLLLGGSPREFMLPAVPFSIIVANDTAQTIALLSVRFDMIGPRAKHYSVIHYADTLRNPQKADFLAGTKRFVCAEPGYTALLLRREGEASTRGRSNLDNLRLMLDMRATLDCVAFADGCFQGPDTLGAFNRLAKQREMEGAFIENVSALDPAAAEALLLQAAEDQADRARRTLARKLLEGLQTGGLDEMLARARAHRLKIALRR